jgi:hypothetical protein
MKKLILTILIATSGVAYSQTTVHMEDFQSGMPAGYTVVDNDGLTPDQAVSEYTSAWITVQDPDNPSDTVAGSTSYFEPIGTADRWLITPAVTLGGYGNYLYWNARSHDASFPDSYQILISVTDDQITSFTDTLDAISMESELWQSRSLNLSELGYDDVQTVYFAFVNRTNDGFKLYLDDIQVDIEDPRGLRPVGIDELAKNSFIVYPNPSNTHINIPIERFNHVEILDLSGMRVLTSETHQIDVSSLNTGNYFIKVYTNDSVLNSRFVKD